MPVVNDMDRENELTTPHTIASQPLTTEGHAVDFQNENEDEKVTYAARDAEAASPSLEDEREGRMKGRFNAIRRSSGFRVARDMFLILLLLGWWIPGILRKETRHYWIVTTIWTWFFILLILLHNSRYIPQRPFVRAISATWQTCAEGPWSKVPHKFQLALGWGAVLVLFLASAFGIAATSASPLKWRAVSLCGIVCIYGSVYLLSAHRKHVKARPVILGLCFQVILGLFVFKSVSYLMFSV